jgi:hypothetical protein
MNAAYNLEDVYHIEDLALFQNQLNLNIVGVNPAFPFEFMQSILNNLFPLNEPLAKRFSFCLKNYFAKNFWFLRPIFYLKHSGI